MKKLISLLNSFITAEGVYVPYSWHAPLNEAGSVSPHSVQTNRSRASKPQAATSREVWV